MPKSDISNPEFWKLEKNGTQGLGIQLENLIRKWINHSNIGDRFPAENDIAKWASVTRKTVRKALKKAIDSGYFYRRPGFGTVLKQKSDFKFHPPHPLENSLQLYDSASETLNLILFSSPERKDFWLNTIEKYHSANPQVEVNPIWTPLEVSGSDAYKDFIEKNGGDLVYVGDRLAKEFIADDFFKKLSPEITSHLDSDDFFSKTFFEENNKILDYLVPLCFPLWGVLINKDKLANIDCNIPSRFTQASLTEWLASLRDLPNLFGSPGKLFAAGGIPVSADTQTLKKWLAELFLKLTKLRVSESQIKWRESYPYESIEDFLNEKTAVYIGNIYPLTDYLSKVYFPWQCSTIQADMKCSLPTGINSLGIPLSGKNYLLAESFMHFITKEKILSRMASVFHYGVFRKESNKILSKVLFQNSSIPDIFEIIESHTLHNHLTEKCNYLLDSSWGYLIRDVMAGDLAVGKAIEIMLKDFTADVEKPEFVNAGNPQHMQTEGVYNTAEKVS